MDPGAGKGSRFVDLAIPGLLMSRPARSIRIIATIVGIAYAGILYLGGIKLQDGATKAVSYLPTVATLLIALWDLWLWKLPAIQRLSKRPWIAGTWAATLTPTDDSQIPEGGNRGPIPAYLVVKQTFWSISVRQYTVESKSESRAAIWANGSGGDLLTYTYNNRPKQQFESRSLPHLGTSALDVVSLRPTAISGEYFTDRYTKGDMELRLVDRSTDHASYAAVLAHHKTAEG